jgi:hypothetical protein
LHIERNIIFIEYKEDSRLVDISYGGGIGDDRRCIGSADLPVEQSRSGATPWDYLGDGMVRGDIVHPHLAQGTLYIGFTYQFSQIKPL